MYNRYFYKHGYLGPASNSLAVLMGCFANIPKNHLNIYNGRRSNLDADSCSVMITASSPTSALN